MKVAEKPFTSTREWVIFKGKRLILCWRFSTSGRGSMFCTGLIIFILENKNIFEKCLNNHNFWKVSEMDMIYDYNAVTTCTQIIGNSRYRCLKQVLYSNKLFSDLGVSLSRIWAKNFFFSKVIFGSVGIQDGIVFM